MEGLMQILDSIYHNRKVIPGAISLCHHTILFKKKSVTLNKHESSSKVEGWLFLTQFTKVHKHANELKTYSSFLKRMDWGIRDIPNSTMLLLNFHSQGM